MGTATTMTSVRALSFCLFAFVAIQWVDADVNVFGEKMVACGAHPSGCTYSSGDAGAHEVCVTKLPQGFSAKTGQGHWSDRFTGKPWCICIWAYSNYILHNSNPPLDCKSIPDKVLKEKYSLDKFKQCGAMSSTKGCGPKTSEGVSTHCAVLVQPRVMQRERSIWQDCVQRLRKTLGVKRWHWLRSFQSKMKLRNSTLKALQLAIWPLGKRRAKCAKKSQRSSRN